MHPFAAARSTVVSLATLFLCASPLPAYAGLTLLTSEAGAYAFDSVAGIQIDDRDPWTAHAASGSTRSEFDLVTGIGRSYTTTALPANGLRGALSSIGFAFTLHNGGLAPVLFEAGDVAVEVDAAINATPANGISGVFTLLGGFFRMATVGQGRGGQGLFSYIMNDSPLVPGVELFRTDATVNGIAAIDVREASLSAVDLMFSFGQFTIAPRGSATFEFEFSVDASADTGGSALVDALNTARLTMQLPDGATLQSPVPLQWVSSPATSLPEPGSAVMLLVGLAMLAVRPPRGLLRRRQRSGTTGIAETAA